ncbi:MAG: MFS transporter [Pseudomonadota bacterium]
MPENRILSGPPLYAFLFAVLFAEAAAGFETSMIFAAIGKLVQEFKDPSTAGWLITTYMLVGAGSAAIIGRLGDQYGHRSVAIILLLAGAIGSVLSLTVESYWAVLVGRALQGLTAAMLPLCFGMLRHHIEPKFLPIAIGLMVTGSGVGAISGLLVGGLIVDNFPWRTIFVASAVLAGTAAMLLFFWAPPSPQRDRIAGGQNLLTGLTFVPAIAGILLVVSQGQSWGLISPTSLSILLSSVGLFTFWMWRSLIEENPLINVRLFADRNCLIGVISMALLSIGALQVSLIFPLLLQQPAWTGVGLGVSATVAGLVKLPSNLLSLGGGPLSGWMSTTLGDRPAMITGVLLTSTGWLLAAFFHGDIYVIGAMLCVISFGTTIIYAALPNIVIRAAPKERTSEASGVLAVVRTAFMAIGAQLVSEGLSYHTVTATDGSGAQYPSQTAYFSLMLVIAVLTIFLAGLSMLLSSSLKSAATHKLAKT